MASLCRHPLVQLQFVALSIACQQQWHRGSGHSHGGARRGSVASGRAAHSGTSPLAQLGWCWLVLTAELWSEGLLGRVSAGPSQAPRGTTSFAASSLLALPMCVSSPRGCGLLARPALFVPPFAGPGQAPSTGTQQA